MRFIVAFLLGLLLLFGTSFSLTNVFGCINITGSDYYLLNSDLSGANNTVYSGGQRACVRIASDDVTIDCAGYSITNDGSVFANGIQVDAVAPTKYNNVTIMNCPNISAYTTSGIYLSNADNSTIRNVTSYGNTQHGIYLDESHYNNISNCTTYDNNNRGILIWESDYNNVSHCKSYDNSRGFELYYAQDNIFEHCTAYDTSASQQYGVYFNTDCDDSYLVNVTAYNHLNSGVYIRGSSQHYININDSVAYGNGQHGFYIESNAFWMNATNNSAYNNGQDGFFFNVPYYLEFHFNKAFGNGHNGWHSTNPWTENSSHNILYNNTVSELNFSSSTTIRFRIYNLTIDNPYGGFQNYSTLELDDRIYNGEEMAIKWTTNATALPAGLGSFEQKMVDITLTPDGSVIEEIYFRWPESETAGYNEMTFELWEYNASGWSYKNAALGERKNFLYYYWFNPNSDYAILEGGRDRNCSFINASGVYTLTGNAEGEGYSLNIYDNEYACILISADDVVFDCQGYNVTNEHVVRDNNYAFFVNGTDSHVYDNITIRNCPNISEYDGGITFEYSNHNTVYNVTIDANDQSASDAVVLYSANYSNITDMRAYNLWFYGVHLQMGSGYNNITNCLVDNADRGYYVLHSGTSYNIFDNNTARNCNNGGFRMLDSAPANTFINNIAHDNTYGFEIEGANHHFENNTAYSNADSNFWLSQWAWPPPSNITFVNNTAYGTPGGYGFYLNGAYNITYINNTASTCQDGFLLAGAVGTPFGSNNRYLNNTATGNNNGFNIDSVSNNTFADNIATNNNFGFSIIDADNLSCTGAEVSGNTAGLSASDSNVTLADMHFFNSSGNSASLTSGAALLNVTMTNATFDNPLGNYQNYTNIDLVDVLQIGEGYTMDWSLQPAPLSADYVSFAEKYLDISTTAGIVSIDSIVFNWLDSELPGYNETVFELLVYNASGWTILNYTPDTTNNEFSMANLNPASTFGILQLNDTTAPQIILNEPANGYATNSTTVNFNFTATDDHAPAMNCSLLINDTFNTSIMASNGTITNIVGSASEGMWNWTIECRDNGNNSNVSETRNFTVDLTVPFVNLTDPENVTYTVSNVPLNFVATDELSGINSCWYVLNAGAPIPIPGCANTTISLANDFYNFTLFAQDNAGNINSTNISFTVNAAPPPPGGGGEDSIPRGSVGTEVSPEGELTVTVTYRGDPVEDAEIDLYMYNPRFEFIESGLTGSDGEAVFNLTEPGTYRIYVSASGLRFSNPYPVVFELTIECISNTDCADNESCMDGSCTSVTGSCGYAADHMWMEYACCFDLDCGSGFRCVQNTCVQEQPDEEGRCNDDMDCMVTEYCDSGNCRPVPRGDCGYVSDHAWFDYECCVDSDCAEGYVCRENLCIVLEEFSIETEDTGFVGEEHTIKVYRQGEPFSGGTVIIISPEGTEYTRVADGQGNVILPLEIEGDYEVRLVFENAVVDSADINSNLKPIVEQEDKPFAFFDELMKACPFIILLLIVIGILYVLYRRRRGEKFSSVRAKKKQK